MWPSPASAAGVRSFPTGLMSQTLHQANQKRYDGRAFHPTGDWLQEQGHIDTNSPALKFPLPPTFRLAWRSTLENKRFTPAYRTVDVQYTENSADQTGHLPQCQKRETWQNFCYDLSGGDPTKYLSHTNTYAYLNTFFSSKLNKLKNIPPPSRRDMYKKAL